MIPTSSPLADVHEELNYGKYEEELKRVKGVWKTLVSLQGKARANPALMPEYKRYLARCIASIQSKVAEDVVKLDDQGLAAEQQAFDRYKQQVRDELNISEREASRLPTDAERWCEKWLTREYAHYERALSTITQHPSKANFGRLRLAYRHMMDTYINIFPSCHSL